MPDRGASNLRPRNARDRQFQRLAEGTTNGASEVNANCSTCFMRCQRSPSPTRQGADDPRRAGPHLGGDHASASGNHLATFTWLGTMFELGKVGLTDASHGKAASVQNGEWPCRDAV